MKKKKKNNKLSLQKLPLSSLSSCCCQEEPTVTRQGWGQCPRAPQLLIPSLSPELPSTAEVPGESCCSPPSTTAVGAGPQTAIPSNGVHTQTLAPHQAQQQQTPRYLQDLSEALCPETSPSEDTACWQSPGDGCSCYQHHTCLPSHPAVLPFRGGTGATRELLVGCPCPRLCHAPSKPNTAPVAAHQEPDKL